MNSHLLNFYGFKYLGPALTVAVSHTLLASRSPCRDGLHYSGMRVPTPPRILWHAAAIIEAAEAGVEVDHVLGRHRRVPVPYARFRAWKRLYDLGYGLSAIGRRCDRDHTSILNGIRRASGQVILDTSAAWPQPPVTGGVPAPTLDH